MPVNSYGAHRLAQSRMAEARREAEAWRVVKAVGQRSSSGRWLQRLGLLYQPAALMPADDQMGGARSSARPAPSSRA